jgi:peptide/nickel transport system permease protein
MSDADEATAASARVVRPSKRHLSRFAWRGFVGGVLVLLCAGAAIMAPWLAPFDPNDNDLMTLMSGPSLADGHWLGTDDLGRDIFSRILYGARPVIVVAGGATMLAVLLGAVLGILTTYVAPWLDKVIDRLADIQMTIPGLVLALLALSLFGPRIQNLIVVLALENWPLHYRVARNHTLNVRGQGYMEAAWLAGVPNWRAVPRHVVPGLLPLLTVTFTISAAFVATTAAGLSFIGLGVQPPDADWGLMVAQGKSQLGSAWWLSVFPALALVALLGGVQMLGDALSQRFSLDSRNNRA